MLFVMVPNSLAPGTSFVEDKFSQTGGGGCGFRMIQKDDIYCVLLLCYYYIRLNTETLALDPGGCGTLLYSMLHTHSNKTHWIPSN